LGAAVGVGAVEVGAGVVWVKAVVEMRATARL